MLYCLALPLDMWCLDAFTWECTTRYMVRRRVHISFFIFINLFLSLVQSALLQGGYFSNEKEATVLFDTAGKVTAIKGPHGEVYRKSGSGKGSGSGSGGKKGDGDSDKSTDDNSGDDSSGDDSNSGDDGKS